MPNKSLPPEYTAAVLETARGELGVMEDPPHANPRIRAYQSATWLEPGVWSWCAAFVCWCLKTAAKGQTLPPWFVRPTTPRAFALELWAKGLGLRVSCPPTGAAGSPGDLVIFRFSHVGIVESADRETLTTIEGNTDGDDDGPRDGVFRCHRRLSLVRCIIHLT